MASLLRRWSGQKKPEKIRLSPLKVLLYLESHQRHQRVSSPDKLGREVGIGGYDTITSSYLWLYDHRYIAPATDVHKVAAEITDPNEFVVTPLGRKALKPYLATFSLEEVAGIAALTLGLGFVLGLTYVLYLLYPSYLWLLFVFDLAVGVGIVTVAALTLKAGRERYRDRVASLIESVVDRG
ncbi:MAG: hypothetical protein OK454_06730 [Thaumarchaeota archaeon]|nr:hypothetical protein [Nitrososphaerota archaeon]